MRANLNNIKTENAKEQSILDDLLQLQKDNLHRSTLYEDLKDDPDAYDYTSDDLINFLIKYNL